MRHTLFLKEFLKHWREVGSVMQSSKVLARKLVQHIDFNTARIIVELGPGSGAVTRVLLQKMHPSARLIVFELNKSFCDELRSIGDDRLTVVYMPAEQMASFLKDSKADYVVSGIPLATLSRETKNLLMQEVKKVLAPNGVYTQFQYTLESYKLLKLAFGNVLVGFTVWNTPPAFIYTCFLR